VVRKIPSKPTKSNDKKIWWILLVMGAHCFDNKEQQKKTAIAIAIASRFLRTHPPSL